MVRVIDWEERFWNLTHDIAVRLAIEHHETDKQMTQAVSSAVFLAASTCTGYREMLDKMTAVIEGGK